MADQLAGSFKATLTPPGGSASVTEAYTLASETHAKSMKRTIVLPAGTTDFQVPLSDFATVSFMMLQTNNPIAIKYVLNTNTPRTCRKVLVDTPNKAVIPNIFITTTLLPATIDFFAVGD